MSSFHLNGYTLGFHPQLKNNKIELCIFCGGAVV